MIGVVMLVNEFPPLPVGGAEMQAERLSEHLGNQGLHVGVLTRGADGLPAHQQCSGYWVERIPQRGPGKLKAISFMAGAMAALIRRRREYQILHAHLAFAPAIVAAIIGRLLGKRVIVKFGNSGPYGDVQTSLATRRGRLKLALLRRWVDISIALSAEMESELLAAGFARDRVLRMVNGIDTHEFQPAADRAAAKDRLGLAGKTVALFVGRLAPQKALPVLLEAFQSAVAACPDLHLVLAGDGPDRTALERQAAELGLAPHVTFTGNVTNVKGLLGAADMFVLSSEVEGISNALLEAMASGLACVATAVGGTPEVLDHGQCGVLLPPRRADLLSEALISLARSPAEVTRLGAQARARILAHYAFEVVDNQYRALYERLLRAGAPSVGAAALNEPDASK
jgi:glycosyltransferase involved in cell wall biosynthesis